MKTNTTAHADMIPIMHKENKVLMDISKRILDAKEFSMKVSKDSTLTEDAKVVKNYKHQLQAYNEIRAKAESYKKQLGLDFEGNASNLFSRNISITPADASLLPAVLEMYNKGSGDFTSNEKSAAMLVALAERGLIGGSVIDAVDRKHTPAVVAEAERLAGVANLLDGVERDMRKVYYSSAPGAAQEIMANQVE